MVETDRRMWGLDRPPSIVEASNIHVVWNTFIGNYSGAISLPYPWERAHDTMADCNAMSLPHLHVPGRRASTGPVFLYNDSRGHVKQAPRYLTLDEWRAASGNDVHSYTFGLRFPMLRTRTVDLELDPDAAFFTGI